MDDTQIDISISSCFSKNVDIEVSSNVGGFSCLFFFFFFFFLYHGVT